jgi:hypothetical protein
MSNSFNPFNDPSLDAPPQMQQMPSDAPQPQMQQIPPNAPQPQMQQMPFNAPQPQMQQMPFNVPQKPLPRPPIKKSGFNPVPLIIGIVVVLLLLVVGIILFAVFRNKGSPAPIPDYTDYTGNSGNNNSSFPPNNSNSSNSPSSNTPSSSTPPPNQTTGSIIGNLTGQLNLPSAPSSTGNCSTSSQFPNVFRDLEPKDESSKIKSMSIPKSNGNPCQCFDWCANNGNCLGFKYTPNFDATNDKCYFMTTRFTNNDFQTDKNKIYFQKS